MTKNDDSRRLDVHVGRMEERTEQLIKRLDDMAKRFDDMAKRLEASMRQNEKRTIEWMQQIDHEQGKQWGAIQDNRRETVVATNASRTMGRTVLALTGIVLAAKALWWFVEGGAK